jgi:hypothetical protein
MLDSNFILLDQRRNDLIREREMHDLAQEALAGHENNIPFYADVLAAFGRQLINWGEQLEQRYTLVCADNPSPQLTPES